MPRVSVFDYWQLNPGNYTLHDGRGYYIDLEKLISQAEWDDWLRHIARKGWPSPEAAFRELFPRGPLATAAAVRKRVDAYAKKHNMPKAIGGDDEHEDESEGD